MKKLTSLLLLLLLLPGLVLAGGGGSYPEVPALDASHSFLVWDNDAPSATGGNFVRLPADNLPPGPNGASGLNTLIALTPEPIGPNCTIGGQLLQHGQDDNADGVLDPGEVDGSDYICNGEDGGYHAHDVINAYAYATLADADAAAIAAERKLVISTQWDTVPTTLSAQIEVLPGGKINNSGPLTFLGGFEAGPFEIFIGTGSVTFGGDKILDRRDEWFGNESLNNIVMGAGAFASNQSGGVSIAIGQDALASSVGRSYGLAIGPEAARDYVGVEGSEIVAVGPVSFKRTTTGNWNTGIGSDTAPYNTTGDHLFAGGQFSLFSNTTGSRNTGGGSGSGKDNTTGDDNTNFGYRAGALDYPTTGSRCSYFGSEAGPEAAGASPGSATTMLDRAAGIGYMAKPELDRVMILGGGIKDGEQVNVGIGTGGPLTELEIFGDQPAIHSTPFAARGMIALYDSSGNDLANGNPSTPQANTGGGITLGGIYDTNHGLAAWGALKCNKSNATAGDGEGYCDIYVAAADGTMQALVRYFSSGDIELKKNGAGLILTSADGQKKRRARLNTTGDGWDFDVL